MSLRSRICNLSQPLFFELSEKVLEAERLGDCRWDAHVRGIARELTNPDAALQTGCALQQPATAVFTSVARGFSPAFAGLKGLRHYSSVKTA